MNERWTRLMGAGAMAAALALPVAAIPTAAQDDDDLEAVIHAGTCEQPGEARFDIGDLEDTDDTDDDATRTPAGSAASFEEDDDVEATLEELIASPHVVVVRADDDTDDDDGAETAPILACGAIAGAAQDGRLEIALEPVGGSGLSGTALFRPSDDDTDDDTDDEEINVLVRVRYGAAEGAPTTTP